ncbi:MAG: phosphoribosyltransferase family protein, partial [Patescibacteria group bacterium]
MIFTDRHSAGLLLLDKLSHLRGKESIILGLARGGLVVASALASGLGVPFDVLVVKKIPAPGQSELAIGALAPDGVSFIDWKFAQRLGVDEEYIKSQIRQLADQIKQKTLIYRKRKKPINVRDK